MVALNIYDEKEIDTSSTFIREKISDAIKGYLIKHWDECVVTEKLPFTVNGVEMESTLFKIHL